MFRHLKRETKYIQINGEQSTKLQKKLISKNLIFPDSFIKKCKDNANEYMHIPIEVKIK